MYVKEKNTCNEYSHKVIHSAKNCLFVEKMNTQKLQQRVMQEAISTTRHSKMASFNRCQDEKNKLNNAINDAIKWSKLNIIASNKPVEQFKQTLFTDTQLSINAAKKEIESNKKEMTTYIQFNLKHKKNLIENLFNVVNACSHETILKRGYAILMDKNAKPIKTIDDVSINEPMEILLTTTQSNGGFSSA